MGTEMKRKKRPEKPARWRPKNTGLSELEGTDSDFKEVMAGIFYDNEISLDLDDSDVLQALGQMHSVHNPESPNPYTELHRLVLFQGEIEVIL